MMKAQSLAKVALERFYRRKLLAGLGRLRQADLEDLRNRAFVSNLIRQIGLRSDRRKMYGADNRHMNRFGPGLWQIPDQLAGALIFLSTCPMRRALEIGTCDGWTVSVMAAYLRRFHPELQFTTTDVAGRFVAHPNVNCLVPIEYHAASPGEAFAGQQFDFVFIDGDHAYSSVARDYELLGRTASICMFHDIDDRNVGSENVPKFWHQLKEGEKNVAEFQEFLGPRGVMGIGVRRKRER